MTIFKVSFMIEGGNEINGWTEAENLAHAMKRIAEAYPDISYIYWITDEDEIRKIPEYMEIIK